MHCLSSKFTLRTAIACAPLAVLAACSTSPTNDQPQSTVAQTATSRNVTPAAYKADSPQANVFTSLNKWREECGFPGYTENLTLDTSAQAHANYMALNDGLSTDFEADGHQGFTGDTDEARAVHFGYPSVGIGGAANSVTSLKDQTDEYFAQKLADGWVSGVYHGWIVASPLSEIGVGWKKAVLNGWNDGLGSLSLAVLKDMPGEQPLSFPCEGVTGVPYGASKETPTPPGTSGAWGTPITLSGNPTDKLMLLSGVIAGPDGVAVPLQLLDSSNDANKIVMPYSAVAYPAHPLAPNTLYSVQIIGTVNGRPFTRRFTFTTGDSMA